MNSLPPLETLFEGERGDELPLPPPLDSLYGRLRFPRHPDGPHVIGNFVSSLDGVVALGGGAPTGGGEISGFNQHDRMVMGTLRAASDCVIVGAGTLRSVPDHRWTAEYIYRPLASEYGVFRTSLGKTEPPLNVIVTARGEVDLSLPMFRSGDVQVLIVTTVEGARRIGDAVPASTRVVAAGKGPSISAAAVLDAATKARPTKLVLVEGGPHLMGDFLAERQLDELFLTLAPQVAGRDRGMERPGFVAGKLFAPKDPLWATLVGVKRASSHLFLRYAFGST